ncbi:YkgJ family cysteine cluster protein [Variovorax sp. KK3]|uniref:YkgJ family cysteine cluster protein n=1 Tax=Variovorax sp. KK3 TaxID=1855728 RepID=UPI00097BD434|nr:YkgJ family cysteine cluster protein [Variovorax sp. KK3]
MHPDLVTSDLALLQRSRLPLAIERAQSKLARVEADTSAAKLVKASQRAKSVAQRVVWLQRAASAWARPIEAVSACRQGCSHCCHIPVTISHVEARLLAHASGRVPQEPTRSVRINDDVSAQRLVDMERQLQGAPLSPCPFLRAGQCSVYDARPIACRTLVNLDDDDLLCRHAGDSTAKVPYADARHLKMFALMAQAGSSYADIREFFPGSARAPAPIPLTKPTTATIG